MPLIFSGCCLGIMDFKSIKKQFNWLLFNNQTDCAVTYIHVLNQPISRLVGSSDILYIGETQNSISGRYNKEIKTRNTPKNTQLTNIRLTHIFNKINIQNCTCYYVCQREYLLSSYQKIKFLDDLRTWDKKFYLQTIKMIQNDTLKVPLEKYLLVKYAADHLEAPPMNNRF